MKSLRNYFFWKLDSLKGGKIKQEFDMYRQWLASPYNDLSYQEQKKKLNSILTHARKSVPYYSFIDSEHLKEFPVVNKQIIRDQLTSFLDPNEDLKKLKVYHTSGSTGTPFYVYYCPSKVRSNHACLLFHYHEMGYNLGEPLFYFRAWNKINKLSMLKRVATNMLMQDCSATEENIKTLLKRVKGGNNTFLGYVSSLLAYAQRLKQKPLQGVKVIFTGSERLSDSDRSYISEAFGCPVYSRYSNEENGIISQQVDESSKFRVNWPGIWVEILKQDSNEAAEPGEIGRVVVTDLDNYAMPLIRYDTGDLSSYDTTDIFLDSIIQTNNIDGRSVDQLRDNLGQNVNPHHITNLFWGTQDSILVFQLSQDSAVDFTLKYVSNSEIDQTHFEAELKKIFGNNSIIHFERVEDIPLL